MSSYLRSFGIYNTKHCDLLFWNYMDFFDRYWNNCPWTLHKKPINFFLTTAKNSLLVIKSATRNISAQLCEFITKKFSKTIGTCRKNGRCSVDPKDDPFGPIRSKASGSTIFHSRKGRLLNREN